MTAYRPVLDGSYAVIGCKLKQNAIEGCNSCATVVQVLQDLFYVLLQVLFYLWSLLKLKNDFSSVSRCVAFFIPIFPNIFFANFSSACYVAYFFLRA